MTPGKGPYWIGCGDNRYIVKPTTYVNISGEAVLDLVERYDVSVENELIVVLDDVNLPFGKMRLRMKGSSGGHRGLENIIYFLETEEIPRLRIGVGRGVGLPLRAWVLSPFDDKELEKLPFIFDRALEGLHILQDEGPDRAMQVINSFDLPDEEQK